MTLDDARTLVYDFEDAVEHYVRSGPFESKNALKELKVMRERMIAALANGKRAE